MSSLTLTRKLTCLKYTYLRASKEPLIPADLLTSEGTVTFNVRRAQLQNFDILFQVSDECFSFTFSFQNSTLVLQRNDIISILTTSELPAELDTVRVSAVWNHSELYLWCGTDKVHREVRVPTYPVTPPRSLIAWSRKQNLLQTVEYSSEEEFRQRVYACLASIQDKVDATGAFNPFWDVSYSGLIIQARSPKRETDIHPTVHALLSDQMLMSSIDVVPEYQTSVGNLDFMFMGAIKGCGVARMCAEFKLAHSADLLRGLQVQLPAYMRSRDVKYGAYCVISFKGDWFDEPTHSMSINDLYHELHLAKLGHIAPELQNIRVLVYDVAKPERASKRII